MPPPLTNIERNLEGGYEHYEAHNRRQRLAVRHGGAGAGADLHNAAAALRWQRDNLRNKRLECYYDTDVGRRLNDHGHRTPAAAAYAAVSAGADAAATATADAEPMGISMPDTLTRESWEITSREAWAERRSKDVTASIAACLIEGADPYGSVQRVFDHLRGVKSERSPSMRPGILLEAVFPAAVREVHPEWAITKASTYHRIPELRLGCTPDFWVEPDGLIQAKTCSEHIWESWRGRPPLGYTLQTLCELIVTGRQWGVLAVIVRSNLLPLYLYDVPRHPAAEGKLLDAVAAFWKQWDAGEFPVAAPAEELAAMLEDGSHIDLSGDVWLAEEALPQRERLIELRSDANRQIEMIDGQIELRMAKASTAWLDGWEISWKSQHRKEYTVPAQDIRVLRVKRKKSNKE